jgi:beta-galactosidase/beta-glucuronidase
MSCEGMHALMACTIQASNSIGLTAEPLELWSAEAPAVYGLTLQLVDCEGARDGVEACQVAFRHTVLVGGELQHNGRRIMIRGVNRHEHDPILGKVSSVRSMSPSCMNDMHSPGLDQAIGCLHR